MAIGTGLAIAMGLTAAGTATSAVGQYKAGAAAKEAAVFNESVARAQADDAIERGRIKEQTYRQQIKQAIGGARAGFAGQNVRVDSGSPVDVVADIARTGEIDALQIRADAAREAWGYGVQATNERMAGDNALRASRFGMASTILGGGSTLLQMRYGWADEDRRVAQPSLPSRAAVPTRVAMNAVPGRV